MSRDHDRSAEVERAQPAFGTEERPARDISSSRPGGSEARDPSFDGSEQTGAGAPTDPKPPYAVMVIGGIVALALLGLLVALLLR